MKRSLCYDWQFVPQWSESFGKGEGRGENVRIPHNPRQMPLHYSDHEAYQMICGYRRELEIGGEYDGKRLFLQFDGAGHIATVYLNGKALTTHHTGYTGFRVEITDAVLPGKNLLAVKLDTTENPTTPPFGHVIDYLTYGGLYREVWLDVREKEMVTDVFVTTLDLHTARVEVTADTACKVEILTLDGCVLATTQTENGLATLSVPEAKAWSVDAPHLHICRATAASGDVLETKFGFRTIQFTAGGFFLNGEKLFIRGLNRHQCYPYMGYAVPERLQREDARILKEELGCNAVRTSHYPQSRHFIDECDRLGLLVFTEIPGWQHIGDDAWKEQACRNTEEMVLQYRNHPSIILWGVRINESADDDALYARTNQIAHRLDPSRPTSGVRFLEKSHLLEDVYAHNDFSHTGNNPGVKPKRQAMKEPDKPYIVTEHNGHMFPTKAYDPWEKRQSHALRHSRVLTDAMASGEHAGCFGWCMFDYATHKDFGSGDRICYHGVMDAFRNPKLAATVYASFNLKKPTLSVGSSMDIGDYPGGQIGDIFVFSNAQEVKLYKNGAFVDYLENPRFGVLRVKDTVGQLLQTQEGFDKKKAALIRKCLVAIGKKGLAGLNMADYLRMATAMVRYKLTMNDAMQLYGKYIGNWGGESTVWRFDAINDFEVVASVTCGPSTALHLEVNPSHTVLREGDTYDMAAVRIRILDEYGNPTPYAQLPVKLSLTGAAELIGPDVVSAEGGMCGTYIRTTGKPGKATLTVTTAQTQPVTLEFTVE